MQPFLGGPGTELACLAFLCSLHTRDRSMYVRLEIKPTYLGRAYLR